MSLGPGCLFKNAGEMITKAMNSRKVVALLAVIAVCRAAPAMAQRLHNQRHETIMQDVRTQFDELTDPRHDVFEEALNLAENVQENDLEQMRERSRALQDSLAVTVPFMSWREFRELAFNARKLGLEIDSSSPSVGGDSSSRQAEQRNLQQQIDSYEALYRSQAAGIDEVQKALELAVQNKTKFRMDVKTLDARVAAWQGDLNHLRQITLRLASRHLNRLTLEITLMQFQGELQKLALQQAHRKERVAALQKFQDDLQAYAGNHPEKAGCLKDGGQYRDFGRFSTLLASLCGPAHDPDRRITDDLRNLAQRARAGADDAANANLQLRSALMELTRFMHLAGAARYELLAEAMSLSHNELVYQIRLTQINMREHEALIRAGIHGLAAYEKGGIKAGDAGNLMFAMQLLATAAIAQRSK